MPVPTQLSDLNATAASNSPAATDTLSTTDDYIRALSSILARISAGTDPITGGVFNGTVGATTPAAGSFTTLAASGNFAIATNKFTVASASGNTVVAGTLTVTGTITSRLIQPDANATYNLGAAAAKYLNVFATGLSDGATATGQLLTSSGTSVLLASGSDWTSVTIPSLAGTGTRTVVVDSNGVLSAP